MWRPSSTEACQRHPTSLEHLQLPAELELWLWLLAAFHPHFQFVRSHGGGLVSVPHLQVIKSLLCYSNGFDSKAARLRHHHHKARFQRPRAGPVPPSSASTRTWHPRTGLCMVCPVNSAPVPVFRIECSRLRHLVSLAWPKKQNNRARTLPTSASATRCVSSLVPTALQKGTWELLGKRLRGLSLHVCLRTRQSTLLDSQRINGSRCLGLRSPKQNHRSTQSLVNTLWSTLM